MNRDKALRKDRIANVEKELLSAMKNCEVQNLDKLLYDGLSFILPSGQTISKAIDLETYSSGNMKIDEIVPSDQEIHIIGDNAIVSVSIDMKGQYFQYCLDGKYNIIRVWRLFNDNWKVIAGSSIKVPKNNEVLTE